MDLKKVNYAPDTNYANVVIHHKLREHFDGKIVRKDNHTACGTIGGMKTLSRRSCPITTGHCVKIA